MVIHEQKPFEEILKSLEGEKAVFLVGCTDCATVCQTGGEEQLKEMQRKLEEAGKKVTGWVVIEPGCHILEVKRKLREQKDQVDSADSLLVMSCGLGTQAARAAREDKRIHPGCNTLFLGVVQRFGDFAERCAACGDCVLDLTDGLCPMALCSKHLLNGPCGGSMEGKCEVDRERDCGWVLIYERLKNTGRLEKMKGLHPAHSYSKYKPQTRVLARQPGGEV